MLELKFVRANPDAVRQSLKKRGDAEKKAMFEELVSLDAKQRKLAMEVDSLRHGRNKATLAVRDALKESKPAKEVERLKKSAAEIPGKIAEGDKNLAEMQERLQYLLMRLPNVLHESVPVGKDSSENTEVRKWGTPKKPSFELKNHGDLAAEMGWADFERASKASGRGFAYVKGQLALLEQAILRFGIEMLERKGFTLVQTPMLLDRKPYEGVTDLADFENVMYKVEGEDKYFIATSEHPIGAMMAGEVVDEEKLPLKFAGLSACFRKEIGGHGVDQKGLFRSHQFNKVEQFVYCKPEDAWGMHEEILRNTEELWQALAIPYRVVNICTGDIGTVAAKKYDIEAWFPRGGEYREVASCSNCTTYQSNRLNIRYRIGRQGSKDERKELVHTLNNTMVATSRAMVAILENYQNEDGTVTVPKALQKHVSFKTMVKDEKAL